MTEITPRFALPLDLPGGKGDLEAPQFHRALEESELSGPAPGTHLNPTASGKALFGGRPQSQFFYADANGTGGTGTPGGAPVAGPKQVVQTDNKLGGKTVKLQDFAPPGWEDAGGDPAACYRLACAWASKTAPTGESPTGGGGIILYEATAQRIKTDKAAGDVALEQIKRHIDAEGLSSPASASPPAAASSTRKHNR